MPLAPGVMGGGREATERSGMKWMKPQGRREVEFGSLGWCSKQLCEVSHSALSGCVGRGRGGGVRVV